MNARKCPTLGNDLVAMWNECRRSFRARTVVAMTAIAPMFGACFLMMSHSDGSCYCSDAGEDLMCSYTNQQGLTVQCAAQAKWEVISIATYSDCRDRPPGYIGGQQNCAQTMIVAMKQEKQCAGGGCGTVNYGNPVPCQNSCPTHRPAGPACP